MAASPYGYVKLPAFQYPEKGWDMEGLGNALTDFRKAKETNVALDQGQQKLDLARQAHDETRDDKRITQIGNMAKVIDSMPADDPDRQVAWAKLVSSHQLFAPTLQKHGVDPSDAVSGPKFLMAQAGIYDPDKQRLTDAQIKQANAHAKLFDASAAAEPDKRDLLVAQAGRERSHGNYYDAASKKVSQQGDAATMNAETRRLGMMSDITQRYGDDPTRINRDQWDADNQPGGIINIAFGGKPVPFDQAPYVLAQAKQGHQQFQTQFEPDAEEKQLGITREDKIKAMREQRINQMYGAEPKSLINKGVKLTPSGDFQPRKGSSTVSERQGETIARNALSLLEQGTGEILSERGVGGTVQQFFGQTANAEDPWVVKQASGWGDSGRAYRKIKAAIIDLNFALSGKTVTDKERNTFLDLYLPQWNDSHATQKDKLGMVRNYFDTVMQMRNSGASEDELKAVMDNMLNQPPSGNGGRTSAPQTDPPVARGKIPPGGPQATPPDDRSRIQDRYKQWGVQ